ncbi:hypothetical protein Tco_0320822 [Tanacetum coccineum]
MRIDPTKTPKEPTYQVVLDALALTTFYPAFLITTEVPIIYMHQFWHTITKIKHSSSYKFKLDKKKCTIDVEVFHDILQICPTLPNQEFLVPPSFDPEIVSFIKELRYIGDIASVTKVYTDHMHQPWRTFAVVINRCLSMKTTCLDKIRLSRAQILKMRNSTAYKTYLAFATGATTPKKARKFKKPTSHSKKKTVVVVDEPAEKPAKKPDGDSNDENDQQSDNEITESNYGKIADLNKTDDEEETHDDKFVHTTENYVPTNDETEDVDDKEYDRINEEYAEHENVNQEVAGDQVKDDAQATVTAVHATQKTEVPLPTKKQETKYTITSSDTVELQEFHQKRTLFKTMTKTKSFNKNTKHKALYHALIEYILEDENAMDKGVCRQVKEEKSR